MNPSIVCSITTITHVIKNTRSFLYFIMIHVLSMWMPFTHWISLGFIMLMTYDIFLILHYPVYLLETYQDYELQHPSVFVSIP